MKSASEFLTEGQEFEVRRQWVVTPPSINFRTKNVRVRIESISGEGQVTFSSDTIELQQNSVHEELVAAHIESGTINPI